MTQENTAETIEIPEEVIEAPKPTDADLKDAGFHPEEIAAAERHGMIAKPAEKKEITKPVEEVKPEQAKEPEKKEEPKPKPATKADDEGLPEEYKTWNKNEQGLYWARKKEKSKRQYAEAERDHAMIRIKALEKELEAARVKPEAKKADKDPLDDLLEGEDKPKENEKYLTEADLERREKEKAEKAETETAEKTARAAAFRAKLDEFDTDARERFEDYDHVADLAREIIQNHADLTVVFKEDDVKAEAAFARAQRVMASISNALNLKDGEKTPAELVYELGKLHPSYKPDSAASPERLVGKEKAEEPQDPEKVKRMMENAQRRSSASVGGGGGRRPVSFEEMTAADLAKLPIDKFIKVPAHVRERILSQA